MIVFDLKCTDDHVFEAWFRDGETYEAQAEAGEISCPVCGCTNVAKALMAPNVAPRSERRESARIEQVVHYLRAVHDHVEKNFDDVGRRFPEEARKMHYGEAEKRNIYGQATSEEAEELEDEDIEFGFIPPVPRYDS
ncbi:MAG: DUF1178 family protein [Alphaproteobacteria bacterium]